MRALSALLSALWKYAAGRRHILLTYTCLFIAANVTLLIEPIVIGKLLNTVQQAAEQPSPLQSIIRFLITIVLLTIGFWILHGPARVMERSLAFHVRVQFVDHLYRIISHLPIQWHKNHHSGETINRMRKSSTALYNFTGHGWQFIEMIIRLIGSITALFFLLPAAAFTAVAVTLFTFGIVFLFDRFLLKAYDAINKKEHFTASALHDYITNIFTVITLRLEKLTHGELWRRMTHYFPFYRKTAATDESKWFLTTLIISIMTACLLVWYAWSRLAAGEILLAGTFYMLYEYLQKIGNAFYTFAWKYSETVEQYADFLAAKEIAAVDHNTVEEAAPLPKNWKTIEVKNLDFRYEDEEQHEQHLWNIHLTLGRGKRIALVGESGSGKSTLMSLLRNLHTPDRAMVSCDGVELPQGLRQVAETVTLIPQEPEIFSNTIEYNITVDTDQSRGEIMEDVRLAAFESVLVRLPHGLQTDIAEKGVNLSGGEKQRLALARGVFAAKQSDIILLDEPTSSVDSTNEFQIYRNIFERFSDRCIVSSIHKLHLLPLFDQIYVLEHGRIIEEGPLQKLLDRKGHLSRLWEEYTVDADQ